MCGAGFGQQFQHAVEHAKTRAQNGYDDDGAGEKFRARRDERRRGFCFPETEQPRGLVSEHNGYLMHGAAEFVRRCVAMPQPGQPVVNDGVIYDG